MLYKHQEVCVIDEESIAWRNGVFRKEYTIFDADSRIDILGESVKELRKRFRVLTIGYIVSTTILIGIILLILQELEIG